MVAYRVPREESVVSPPSHCPSCDAPIRNRHNVPVLGWLLLRGRCFDCRAPISARYPLVEAETGAAFAATAVRFGDQPRLLPAYLCFVAIGIALTLIDVDVRRLPDKIVLPAYPALAVLLMVAWDLHALLRAAYAGAALFAFFFLVATLAAGSMGFGDVKLSGLVGGMLGYLSWGALLTGAFLGFFLGAVVGVVLMATTKAGRKTAVPFGPFMILGAWVSILGAGDLGEAYLRSLGV
ncbi:MAG: peptidase [Nocardioidaceae bacterium]|nr:peptidase [Nocardioidaceae bacterium]